MGCDIHFHIEYKVDNHWEYDQTLSKKCDRDIGRNYSLFSILAGIRGAYDPMIEPRNVPKDLSLQLSEIWNVWNGGDGHTPTYYTMSEFLSLKDKTQIVRGYLNVSDYKMYKKRGYSDNWMSFYKASDKIVIISNEEMDRICNLTAFLDETEYATQTIWEMSNHQLVPHFWDNVLSQVTKKYPDPEKVRCVFWFDN